MENNIKVINLKNWEAFEEKIDEDRFHFAKLGEEPYTYISRLLFRGHGNKDWHLHTSLERFAQEKLFDDQEYSWEDYYNILRRIKSVASSLTSNKFELPELNSGSSQVPPSYEFMIYLRHHGFPSPLLDWTASPYVAAFFAFNEATESQDVAIFSFREHAGMCKVCVPAAPHIEVLGPYAETHRRHHQQQCEYTICYREFEESGNQERIYSDHEKAQVGNEQDIMKKYIIPSNERNKVMRKLDLMNINAFSLFGNEEGLMSMLAYREMER